MSIRRRFELRDGSSSKFWEVEAKGQWLEVRFGRIGSAGQEKSRDCSTAAAARRAATLLIEEKSRKGYREVGSPSSHRSREKPTSKSVKRTRAPGPESIGQLVDQLDAALREREEGVPPKAHRPASPALIRRFEKHLGRRLPPSYRAFLELHDGYERLAWPGSLWPISALLPGGSKHAELKRWQRQQRADGELDHEVIPIASVDDATNWVLYLDPEKPSAGDELAVVEWTPSQSYEFASLRSYFEEELAARTKRHARTSKVEAAPEPPVRHRPVARKFRGKTYRVVLDRSPWKEQVARGNFGFVDQKLQATFAGAGREGRMELDVHLVDLGRTGRGAAKKLARLGLAPGTLEHLLAFAGRYPKLRWKEEIVALGSQIPRPGQWPLVPRLRYDLLQEMRTLGLAQWVDDWAAYAYRFIAIDAPPRAAKPRRSGR